MRRRLIAALILLSLLIGIGTGIAVSSTVLYSMKVDGVVGEGPASINLYISPSGIQEIPGGKVHMGTVKRGIITTNTYWAINTGGEIVDPRIVITGENVNCPECGITVKALMENEGPWPPKEVRKVTLQVYPRPDTPTKTPIAVNIDWVQ